VDILPRSSARYRAPSLGRASFQAFWTFTLIGIISASTALAADPPAGQRADSSASSTPNVSGAAILEKAWPDHPEWLAMLADILVKGERLNGGDGWFRKGISQTRFDWKSTSKELDTNGDASISRSEFRASGRFRPPRQQSRRCPHGV
jgi:hypothetical protein